MIALTAFALGAALFPFGDDVATAFLVAPLFVLAEAFATLVFDAIFLAAGFLPIVFLTVFAFFAFTVLFVVVFFFISFLLFVVTILTSSQKFSLSIFDV
jgi:hypothetical protein